MVAYGFARSHVRALAVVCSALGLFACDDGGACELTEDVRGEWRGTYIESTGSNETIVLTLTDDGVRVSGVYERSKGDTGQINGLQSGSQLVFTVQASSGTNCFGELSGQAEVCGNSLSYTLECDGDSEASGTLTRKVDACKYANDGECDEPTLCDVGSDSADCSGETCSSLNDGICDEPEGTGRCMEGSDTSDCAQSCLFVNNGVCNEPEGTNQCVEGSDFNDCNPGMMTSCPFQGDGICDEPEGTNRCFEGFDPFDCGNVMMGCPFQNDGVCDEPEGTARCFEGSDFNDCFNSMPCSFLNDGVCDEPEGTGDCPEGSDINDCSSCNRPNDGVCDEPEGTGLCFEGSDFNDCAPSELTCGAVLCSVLDPSGLGQLDACCTASSECGVVSSTGTCTLIEEAQDGACEAYATPVASFPLPACCLPSGLCGLQLPSADGCVAVTAAPLFGISAVPCDDGDDAGVP